MDKKTAKNLKYLVGVAVVLVFVGIAFSTTTSESFVNPYKSVSEVVGKAQSYQGRQVQVQGYVVEGSVKWVPKNLNFTLTDGRASIRVAYYGVIPSTFPLGRKLGPNSRIDVVAIGVLRGDTLVASKLLVKCPSKYEAKLAE